MEIGSTLRDEDGRIVAENRMLRGIFCLRGRQGWECEIWREVHKEEVRITYFSQNIIRVCY
jgi:hypothetical protein